MPLRSPDLAGVTMPPFVSCERLENVPIVIVQAFLRDQPDQNGSTRRDVAYVFELMEDAFDANGVALPVTGIFTLSADQPSNPRRRWITAFEDPKADPVGPVALVQIPANVRGGFVWDPRPCPFPTESLDRDYTRSLYGWPETIAILKRERGESEDRPPRRAAISSAMDEPEEVPF